MKLGVARLLAGILLVSSLPATARNGDPAPAAPAPAPPAPAQQPPRLLVVISVDQYSADLFGEYRQAYTGGLLRLQQGAVFPKGYQSHAATETCPGHSTILTGNRPGHTGIIANDWVDQSVARADKTVYCAEDPSVPGTDSDHYAASVMRLLVPALGDYMKRANPASRIIAVAGKDRAAIMMGGHAPDQIWWWGSHGFTSYRGTATTPLVDRVNAGILMMMNEERPPMDLPDICVARDHAVQVGPDRTVGTGRFARAAGDMSAFRASPEYDAAVLAMGASEVEDLDLGKGPATDLLILGLSATDYVGHTYGTHGSEMCLQTMALDRELGAFFDRLDARGIDYMVVLTADHGGNDLPEREREQGIADAQRVDPSLSPAQVNAALRARTGLTGDLVMGGTFGDIYVNRALAPAQQARVLTEAKALYLANPQVQTVFTHDELAAAPEPSGPPESWTLLQEAKASFNPDRSGDLIVLLKPRVTPIMHGYTGSVATHGSPWDYDRRVPILFWRKGMTHFEQPLGVETVDILPTLAAQIGLPLPATGIDGRCLDLDAGPGSSCPAR